MWKDETSRTSLFSRSGEAHSVTHGTHFTGLLTYTKFLLLASQPTQHLYMLILHHLNSNIDLRCCAMHNIKRNVFLIAQIAQFQLKQMDRVMTYNKKRSLELERRLKEVTEECYRW